VVLFFRNIVDWTSDASRRRELCARPQCWQCEAVIESVRSVSPIVAAVHLPGRKCKPVCCFMSNNLLRFMKSYLMFWMVSHLFTSQILFGAESVDRSLIPNTFIPESGPAHSISQLAGFVLLITGVMFLLVTGLLAYVVIRYRRRKNDDGM